MDRKTFTWTVLSGCVYALGPFVFLIAISYILGDTAAGVYSAASMIALQLMTVGKYSVRNFQVSDVRGEYSFSAYFSYRIITCALMMLIVIGWAFLGGYRGEILVTVICFGIYKMGEALSDVFEGYLQQKLHLDVAGRCQCVMNLSLIAIFVGSLFIIRNLMIATIILAVAAVAILFILYVPLARRYEVPHWEMSWEIFKGLTFSCFALFLGSFLYSFMNNTPKYAIRAIYPEIAGYVALGRFNQLFMPVFAVDLVAGFTMRMWLAPMAQSLEKREIKAVDRKILAQMGVITGITVAAMVGMYFLGGPILSFLYHTDLTGYAFENALLMLAGGFVAAQTLFENILIIYRGQKHSIIFNVASAVGSAIIVPLCVYFGGLRGAVIGYLLASAIRALGYFIIAMRYRKVYNKKQVDAPTESAS